MINHEQQPYLSLRDSLSNIFKKRKSQEEFWALKDVTFNVMPGDTIGIIGKNGAGKSTLLKILSKITPPTDGKIIARGRIASLLEVGTGFHSELSGRENIFMNGSILGMRRVEILRNFDAIVDFAGVEKFIDTPLKHYSSGMQLRLAFAVAAFLENEVLIIDEVLAVGDAEFQKKCLGKMGEVSKSGRTILFVSHHLGTVRQLCNKGILLVSGKVQSMGEATKIIQEYQANSSHASDYIVETSKKDYFVKQAQIEATTTEFYHSQAINFKFLIGANKRIEKNKFLLIRVLDELEQVLFSCETELIENKEEYRLQIPDRILTKGVYQLNCIIYHPAIEQYDNVSACCKFEILDTIEEFGHLETFDIGKFYITQKWS